MLNEYPLYPVWMCGACWENHEGRCTDDFALCSFCYEAEVMNKTMAEATKGHCRGTEMVREQKTKKLKVDLSDVHQHCAKSMDPKYKYDYDWFKRSCLDEKKHIPR